MQETNGFRYQMIMTTEYVEDSGKITAYGIRCRNLRDGGESSQEGEQTIPNISTRPALVRELVDKLNKEDADPVHLHDFIYDFLP